MPVQQFHPTTAFPPGLQWTAVTTTNQTTISTDPAILHRIIFSHSSDTEIALLLDSTTVTLICAQDTTYDIPFNVYAATIKVTTSKAPNCCLVIYDKRSAD